MSLAENFSITQFLNVPKSTGLNVINKNYGFNFKQRNGVTALSAIITLHSSLQRRYNTRVKMNKHDRCIFRSSSASQTVLGFELITFPAEVSLLSRMALKWFLPSEYLGSKVCVLHKVPAVIFFFSSNV